MQKTIAKIKLENVRKNAVAFKNASGVKLCAVVKADAYGHGAEEVACSLADIADLFAVALIDEALAIRVSACGKGILVFTPPVDEAQAYAIAANGLIASVPNLYTARLLLNVCKRRGLSVKAHVKVNTGMNRYGMNASMLGKVCTLLRGEPLVQVEGIYSHLYGGTRESAEAQRRIFEGQLRVCKRYFPNVLVHLSATYGVSLGREFAYDMVRVGLGLYGYSPVKTEFPLYKAMSVWAQTVDNRRYAYGGAGYGELSLDGGERLTLCRAGYADGFLRSAQNGTDGGEANANRLCMDVCIRKGTHRRGGYIPLLTDADRTARETGTLAYEVLCAATRRAERIYER